MISHLNTATTGVNDAGGNDVLEAIQVDGEGNIYAVGRTNGSLFETNGGGSNNDLFAFKMNSVGALIWSSQLGSVTAVPGGDTSGEDWCQGIDIDNSGKIYCGMRTTGSLGEAYAGGTGYDMGYAVWNPDGTLNTIEQIGSVTSATLTPGTATGQDQAEDIKVDAEYNVYIIGNTELALTEANGGSLDMFVVKYNSAGVIQWLTQLGATTTYPSGSNASAEIGEDLEIGLDGTIYVAARVGNAFADTNAAGFDASLFSLNNDGTLNWANHNGGTGIYTSSGEEYCEAVAIDPTGNVICAGTSDSGWSEANAGGSDFHIWRIDRNGSN